MARGKREDTLSLNQQVYDTLQSKEGFGRSRHEDKILKVDSDYIYSFNTMKTYIKHCNYFTDWCKSNPDIKAELGHKPRTLEECKPYVESWIRAREEQGLSAYTVKMEKAAVEKLYGERWDFKTKSVSRVEITRSRGAVERDKHFSEEKNADLVNVCRCVGFRRSELEKVKAADLIQRGDQWYVGITGKGGRYREAPVLNNNQEAIDFIKGLDGHNYVHNAADIHGYRSDYATEVYNQHKGDLESLKGKMISYTQLTGKTDKDGNDIYKSALYYCRGDRKGVVLDREAMIRASQALGHNRESVVGEHYIKL